MQTLDDAGRKARARMILIILPESAAALYCDVKRYGDITRGVVTQCVVSTPVPSQRKKLVLKK
jgi:hypothetical protein